MTARTTTQNNALWKGCGLLAEKLNDAGLDMVKILKPGTEIPWTPDSVQSRLFNEISKVMYDGRTSSQLDTVEIQKVWEVLIRHLASKHSIEQAWPSYHGE